MPEDVPTSELGPFRAEKDGFEVMESLIAVIFLEYREINRVEPAIHTEHSFQVSNVDFDAMFGRRFQTL